MTEEEIRLDERQRILDYWVELLYQWVGLGNPYNDLANACNDFTDAFRAGGEFDVGEEFRMAREAATKDRT